MESSQSGELQASLLQELRLGESFPEDFMRHECVILTADRRDFNGNQVLDVASVSYNVIDYYEEPEPKVTMHINHMALPTTASVEDSIRATIWDGEGMVYLAQPAEIKAPASKSLIHVANYAISVEVHPARSKVPINKGEGLKVLYGSLSEASDGSTTRKPLGGDPFPALASTTSKEETLDADAVLGAVVLRLTPTTGAELEWEDVEPHSQWGKASDVPVHVTLDLQESGLTMPEYKFTKVDQLWWGKDDKRFKGQEFYNMPGFHFSFLDSKVHIAHIQFWTAGE